MPPVNLLTDCQVVRIQIPLQGRRTLALDCFPGDAEPPAFEVQFYPGQLPVDELDFAGQCSISFDVGGLIYVVRAKISEVIEDDKLKLTTVQSYSNEQKREYFRVDTELIVDYQPSLEDLPQPEHSANPEKKPVNLSGGGIRFEVAERFRVQDRLNLKLFFEEFPKLDAKCVGQVVRIEENGEGNLQVCLHFVEISQADRDRIISYCFAQQRELLRKRVKVKSGL